uniref:DSBA-like thioredoxin domain-containing protein n=1 Tax=Acrobeloides nanus TaxID=290746 RepID=A0A914DVL9_9BILA
MWSRDEPIHEIQNIKEVCDKLKIANSDKLISEINSQKVKDLLKKNTEEALAYGAFGAPWIVLKREGKEDSCFFGGDRFPILCNELGIEFQGPLKNKI